MWRCAGAATLQGVAPVGFAGQLPPSGQQLPVRPGCTLWAPVPTQHLQLFPAGHSQSGDSCYECGGLCSTPASMPQHSGVRVLEGGTSPFTLESKSPDMALHLCSWSQPHCASADPQVLPEYSPACPRVPWVLTIQPPRTLGAHCPGLVHLGCSPSSPCVPPPAPVRPGTHHPAPVHLGCSPPRPHAPPPAPVRPAAHCPGLCTQLLSLASQLWSVCLCRSTSSVWRWSVLRGVRGLVQIPSLLMALLTRVL